MRHHFVMSRIQILVVSTAIVYDTSFCLWILPVNAGTKLGPMKSTRKSIIIVKTQRNRHFVHFVL